MRSRHETQIVRGAQRYLEQGETFIRALVAVPRGSTQRRGRTRRTRWARSTG
jgi:hypothetical protein